MIWKEKKENGRYAPFHIREGNVRTVDLTRKMCPLSKDDLDRKAWEIMSQGYSKKKNPVCQNCFVQKSNNGSCNC